MRAQLGAVSDGNLYMPNIYMLLTNNKDNSNRHYNTYYVPSTVVNTLYMFTHL